MTNFVDTFKKEIARIARKELKAELDGLRKQASAQRAEISSLRKQVKELQVGAARMAKSMASGRSIAGSKADVSSAAAPKLRPGPKPVFSAERLREQRHRLGLTQEHAAHLLNVSALSLWKWESGKAAPRASKMPSIMKFMTMGKREAKAQLAALAGA